MDRQEANRRMLASLGALWVYFVAQSEGDFASGSSTLTFFQRSWAQTRAAIIALQPSFDASIPRSLPVSGAWTNDTRFAVLAVLTTYFGSTAFNETRQRAIPTTAGSVASWFNTAFEPFAVAELSRDDFDVLWEFEALLDEGMAGLNAGLSALTEQVLSGIRIGEPEVVSGGNEQTREIIDRTSSGGAVADTVDAAAASAGTSFDAAGGGSAIELPGLTITGRRPSPPSPWPYFVIALGAISFGGLAYWLYAYRRRKVE